MYKTLTCGIAERDAAHLIRQGKEVQREIFKVGWLTVKFPNMGVRIHVDALSNKNVCWCMKILNVSINETTDRQGVTLDIEFNIAPTH